MPNLITVILGGLTVFLTIVIIVLAVKIRKLQTGTTNLKLVAHNLINCVNPMDKSKLKCLISNNELIRLLSSAI